MRNLADAKDPALRGSAAAMLRAAGLARRTAIETNTCLIVVKDGKLVRILAVHEALESVNEKINALGLVPQGFGGQNL